MILPLLRLFVPALCLAASTGTALPDQAALEAMQARFAPVALTADVSGLADGDRRALKKLIEASKLIDALFLRQVWWGNEAALLSLQGDATPLGKARLRYFLTQKGPWDRQDHNRPFVPGVPAKPAGADFYPADATKEELERWLTALPPAEKERAAGFFSVIKREKGGGFRVVPYSLEYQNELTEAARLLREAAAAASEPTLKTYLDKRAAALLSDDYYDSDVAWMELAGAIEPTFGPYETYEDEWFGAKAAFESFVGLVDSTETAKLQRFSPELQWLEDRLPIAKAYRNPKLGALAPIRVVNQVFAAGDAARGVATAAFNLPNDERVTREKGAKRTMIKNVQRAKFEVVLVPLAKLALAPADQVRLDFDAFFTHILMHELMHGLGPHEVQDGPAKGRASRQALQEAASALEEAKADVAGLWALQKLADKGVLDRSLEKTMYVTFLASAFRTLRFGVAEAHGKAMALQLGALIDRGAFAVDADGRFSVREKKVRGAVESLAREIMEVQARGDVAAARRMLERWSVPYPEVQAVLDRAAGLPVDIAPAHLTAESLLAE